MKTELILVGKTINKHFIAGIKDYAERITHYMPFTITTIPELKNTKSLSEQQQKEREGELILKQLQPSCRLHTLWCRVVLPMGVSQHRVCQMDRAQAGYFTKTRLRHWWSVWILSGCLQPCQREDFAIQDDLLPSDGKTYLHRSPLSGMHYYKR